MNQVYIFALIRCPGYLFLSLLLITFFVSSYHILTIFWWTSACCRPPLSLPWVSPLPRPLLSLARFQPPLSFQKYKKKFLFAFFTFLYHFKNFNISGLWIDTVGTQAPIQLLALPVYPPVTRPYLYYNLIYLFHSCYFSISYKLNINNACTAIYRK